MYFDRFDIVEAYWCYMAEYHSGQGSKEYALSGTFSRLRFRPRPNLSSDTLEENAAEILAELMAHPEKLRDRRA